MNQSNLRLLDLPDELLVIILKKLNNIQVLYSLVDTANERLDIIARDKLFTSTLNLVLTENNQELLDRIFVHILPRIHYNVHDLTLESPMISQVFLAGTYPHLTKLKLFNFGQDIAIQFFKDEALVANNFKEQIKDLTLIYEGNDGIISSLKDYTINVYASLLTFFKNLQHLNIHGSSIAGYPGLSLCDLPSTTFSSKLTKLCINVSTFDDCLYLLDSRLHELNTLIVRIYDINAPSSIIHSEDNLLNLISFSLTCHSHIRTYDDRVIPLLRRMTRLEELTLCLTVRNRSGLIDGTHLQNEILIHMPLLITLMFDIRTWNTIDDSTQLLTNEDIQRTFTDQRYLQVACSIQYFLTNSVLCHIFTLPFTFDYLQCITNNFPKVSFNHVLYLSVCDSLPFEHEFFLRLAQAFPRLKHLTVTNSTPQTDKQLTEQQPYTIIEYKNLIYLSVMNSDVTYTEQFLLESKTQLPRLTELRVNYEQLKNVTENFTRDTTIRNCAKVKQLITEVTLSHSDDFSLYFPLV